MDPIVIVSATQLGVASPAQWEAQASDGRRLNLRFRRNLGQVRDENGALVASFHTNREEDGVISLADFCDLSGIRLDLDGNGKHFLYSDLDDLL